MTLIRQWSVGMLVKRDHRISGHPSVLSTWGMCRGVAGVAAQPVRECNMAGQQLLGVTAAEQPFPLSLLVDVEKTDCDVDHRGGRRGQHLTGRDGVTGQQQVTAFFVKLLCTQHGALGHAVSPLKIRGSGDRAEVVELDGRDRRLEVCSDRRPDRRFSCAARAGYQK